MTNSVNSTAVLLIAHGSRHQPANDDLHELVARLRGQAGYSIVEPSFLELAEPTIEQGGDRCVHQGANRVLMVPYFLSAGVHLLRDLTAARDDLGRRHPQANFLLGAPLGPHSLLDALVSERIRQLEYGEWDSNFGSSSDAARVYAPMDQGHDSQ
ncbi:sirohydrochlorin chelatase [Singulisphaera sp. PoT]|uniref:sirohydrochlorin chelatase n=1 Tax=Singulisphaera sp. PoT TaxID=3411797 RepID=UPI003BF51A3E